MITFPDYDYGWFGGTDAAVAEAEALGTIGTPDAPPQFTLGTVFKDVSDGAGSVYEGAKNLVSSTYWNLIFGVAIIGIIALVVLGAGARFMRTVEGG